jgi:hypothetical protein
LRPHSRRDSHWHSLCLWPLAEHPATDRRHRMVVVGNAYMRSLLGISGAPGKRDFAELNLHLPACRSLGAGRTLFLSNLGKMTFFESPLIILSQV